MPRSTWDLLENLDNRHMIPRRKCWMWSLLGGSGMMLLLFVLCVDIPSRQDTTTTAITMLGYKTREFYERKHRLPSDLDELKPDPSLRKDGWGQPISYAVTASNTFRLSSLGPSRKSGGQTIEYSFDVSDPAALAGTRSR